MVSAHDLTGLDEEWRLGFSLWMNAEHAEVWQELQRVDAEISRLQVQRQALIDQIPALRAPGASIMPLVYVEATETQRPIAEVKAEILARLAVANRRR